MEDRTLFRKHFNSGQNINMYSLDADHKFIHEFLNREVYQDDVIAKLFVSDEWSKPIRQHILANYKTICSDKQIEFLECEDDELLERYTRQARYSYRNTLKRLFMTLITGQDMEYTRRLDNYLVMLRHISQLESLMEDSENFATYITDNIDDAYINEMVYERLTCDARQEVVANLYTPELISRKVAYEVCNLINSDKEIIADHFKKYKK